MKPIWKTVLTVGLLAFVAGSVTFMAVRDAQNKRALAQVSATNAVSIQPAVPNTRRQTIRHENAATPARVMPTTNAAPAAGSHYYTLYYFHATARCYNCIKFEEYAKKALDTFFTNETRSGLLRWEVYNIELPENNHYVNDYQLYTKSLILAEFKDGAQVRWKNLEMIWNYVSDEALFLNYIKNEVYVYLKS